MASSSSSDELVRLLSYGTFLSKTAEKANALTIRSDFTFTNEDFKRVSMVKDMISPYNDAHIPSEYTKQGLQQVFSDRVDKYLRNDRNEILKIPDGGGEYTYGDVHDFVSRIHETNYTIYKGIRVNFKNVKVKGFWHLDSGPLPQGFNVSNIKDNIIGGLQKLGYTGDLELQVFVDINKLDRNTKDAFIAQKIKVEHSPPAGWRKKSTADKKIITEMIEWTRTYRSVNHEAGTVLVISGDVDIVHAIKQVTRNGFEVILAHGPNVTPKLRKRVPKEKMVRWSNLVDGNI